jgi:hypothetical protein
MLEGTRRDERPAPEKFVVRSVMIDLARIPSPAATPPIDQKLMNSLPVQDVILLDKESFLI